MSSLLTETSINSLKDRFPERIKQLMQLCFFLETEWPLIYIYGQSGIGKTEVISTFLSHLSIDSTIKVSLIDARTCSSSRQVLSALMFQIVNQDMYSLDIEASLMADCDIGPDLPNKIQTMCSYADCDRIILTLDWAESLLNMDVCLINTLSKLHEVMKPHGVTVTVILISQMPYIHWWKQGIAMSTPVELHFPVYSKEQIVSILKRKQQEHHELKSYDPTLYHEFVSCILSMMFDVTHSLHDYVYICDQTVTSFFEPITLGLLDADDKIQLWRLFTPTLREAINSLGVKGMTEQDVTDDMPVILKYLLISAFIASFNPMSSDQKFFVKLQQKKRKSHKLMSTTSSTLSSPKGFTLERLFHIFTFITCINLRGDEPISGIDHPHDSIRGLTICHQNDITSYLDELIKLNLLSRAKGVTFSSDKKWKISDSLTTEYITRLGQSVGFDVQGHLEQKS